MKKLKITALITVVTLGCLLVGILAYNNGYKNGYKNGEERIRNMFKPEAMFFIELKDADMLDKFDVFYIAGKSYTADTLKIISTKLEEIMANKVERKKQRAKISN